MTGTTNREGLLHLSLAEIAAWQVYDLLDPAFGVGLKPGCVARLPALQRGAVWKQGQVELLWDSIMRRFPIGALVLTPKLHGQKERLGIHSDQRWVQSLQMTHHLLDGQQRANAIALGFYDPFHKKAILEEDKEKAVLWLDIANQAADNQRRYLFRLTTLAHPWGFRADKDAGRIEASAMRTALVQYGWRDENGIPIKAGRPTPREAWPYRATVPVPFAWLLQAAATTDSPQQFCSKLVERCQLTALPWCSQATSKLQEPANLSQLFSALQHSLTRRLVAFDVPDEVLSVPPRGGSETVQDIACVEHLFERLNSGGTVPNQEEMAYSMIKAYWPEVEEPIRQLERRRMSEARLFMLSARIAMGGDVALAPGHDELRKRLPDAPTVEIVRRIASEDRMEGTRGRRIHDFFTAGSPTTLDSVARQITTWLESGTDGLPPILHSSIANRSPEVYLLLMWIARRWVAHKDETLDGSVQRPILALTSTLHWFRPRDPMLAARLVAEELDQRSWGEPNLFLGVLSAIAGRDENQSGLHVPPTPDRLSEIIGDPPEHDKLNVWAWWRLGRNGQDETNDTRTILSVKDNRELLLYAQRKYSKTFNFDPAHANSDQHDRPWDYDHILPSSKVKGKWDPARPGLMEWINSIANLRAWPMEENRSDQATCPEEKLTDRETKSLSQKMMGDSFLLDEEVANFNVGCQNPFDGANSRIFLKSAKSRLIRIYCDWYYTLGIAHLTESRAESKLPGVTG